MQEDDAVHVVPTGDIETTVDRVVEALGGG